MNTFTYWFKLADSLRNVYNRSNVRLFLNEYQIISAIQSWALSRPEKFRVIIDQLIAEGAPIEGIGFQSRIKNGLLSPEVAYQRLRDFEKYNLPYQATEFEIRDSEKFTYTDAQKKQIVNEMMTVYFSHPNVIGFWHWTFFDNKKGTSPFALFKYNGQPYACGEEWMRTMNEDFNTNVTLLSEPDGTCCVRGFKGKYEITVSTDSKTQTSTLVLDNNEQFVITLVEK